MPDGLSTRVVTQFSDELHAEVTQCWFEVSRSGGAVGFPFAPVARHEVAEAVDHLAREISNGEVVLVEARQDVLVGWVTLRLNGSKLTCHWATVERLQSLPTHRRMGVGQQLLLRATEHARSLGLEHLRLVLRSGEGLEDFYQRFGWTEVGRHRNALRLDASDDRDEVMMVRQLALGSGGLSD
jgi:GNAT superfamily N-acetyltransferase